MLKVCNVKTLLKILYRDGGGLIEMGGGLHNKNAMRTVQGPYETGRRRVAAVEA